MADYIISGFWPPVPDKITFLVCSNLLTMWYHLKLLTPGTSERKFLECLSAMSTEGSRCPTVNGPMFAKASQAHEFTRHLVDTRVKNMDKLLCRVCVDLDTGEPALLSGHPDGNHKLTRTNRKNERPARAWYGNEVIPQKEEFQLLKESIDKVKPQSKKSIGSRQLCGNSEFQASKEVSMRYKSLDETGILMASCGHGVIHCAVNMYEVCHYWPWLKALGDNLKEFKPLFTEMYPFLSRLHGQAHAWYCQVLYFGHWRDGAAGTLGEETEQVFAWFSRYYSVTHTMSSSRRNDHLTAAIFYWNSRKKKGLANFITRRLVTVTLSIS
ncbi:Uncharacterized protein APZ42_031593 [Daphnia magna]|uniref:CxC3 like cysteine cluster domain-containing protein n=1 Tax=Daphnia magna TaxID=35525 RepID=A0A164MQG2_9CRUS|nr:Uncharacterized protein APZ42_031593 [Daphnia magna]